MPEKQEAAEQFCPETDGVLRSAGARPRPAHGGGYAARTLRAEHAKSTRHARLTSMGSGCRS
jgi:hypothetical protein